MGFELKSCGRRHAYCGRCRPDLGSERIIKGRYTAEVRAKISVKRVEAASKINERYIARWISGDLVADRVTSPIRRWLYEQQGERCWQCGWAETHPVTGNVMVQVDHIDGDRTNNTPNNLRVLCPNCHSLTLTFLNVKRQ